VTAIELLEKYGREQGWSDTDKVDLICSFADIHDEYWTTPSVPGSSKPPLFAAFLDEVVASLASLEQDDTALEPAAPPHNTYTQNGTAEDSEEEDEDGDDVPPLADAALLQRQTAPPGEAVHEVTVSLTVPQLRKSEQVLGPDYNPDAENAPELNQVLVGPIAVPFTGNGTAPGSHVEIVVTVTAGRPICFIKSALYVSGKPVKYLQPRHKTLIGEYEFRHNGSVYRLIVVPPVKRSGR
jgi:hypothetical protein